MSFESLYPVIKLIHLGSLIFWIGPSLGAWWMLRMGNRQFGEPNLHSQFMYIVFMKMLQLEHVAFAGLISSGALMAYLGAGLHQPWLQIKIVLVVLIVIPIEVLDIWYGHVRLPRLFIQRHPVRPYSRTELQILTFYHQRLTPFAIVLLPPTLLAIMWLAIGK